MFHDVYLADWLCVLDIFDFNHGVWRYDARFRTRVLCQGTAKLLGEMPLV